MTRECIKLNKKLVYSWNNLETLELLCDAVEEFLLFKQHNNNDLVFL